MAVALESGVNPWYEDQNMKEDLKRYVQQNLKHKEILDFMKRLRNVYLEYVDLGQAFEVF